VGLAYILKLIHLVDDKIHARSIGKYALLTQQPLKGRSKKGGQRVGEMEVWALQGFSASYILQEMLTLKSDDRHGRTLIHHAMTSQTHFPQADIPESFRTLTSELRGLCFDLDYKAYTTRDVQNWLVTPKIVRKIFVPDPSASIV
jgi:DNA-directed RNA polymerase subunit beta